MPGLGTILVLVVIALLVFLCIRSLIKEHRSGARCECIGDCSKRKIQCQSNPKYYGVSQKNGTATSDRDEVTK